MTMPGPGRPATLALDAVTYAYERSGRPVLDRRRLALHAGAVTALTGPSGSGKSTALFLLGLMLRPTEGQVVVDGVPTTGWSDAERAAFRARRMGFVFQDAALDLRRSVLDNVVEPAVYAGGRRGRVREEARRLLQVLGVDVPHDRRPGQISGGQAQRIGLARALVTAPDIVLADEPTGNLDPATTTVVLATLRDVAARGGTVVIATHDPAVTEMADTVLEV